MEKTLQVKVMENKDTGLSSIKDRIKKNFDTHLWSEQMLRVAVRKGELMATEFEDITGVVYNIQAQTPEAVSTK